MTEHTLTDDCPCGPTVLVVPPSPTQRQMRTWLRQNGHPVGSRGFLSLSAKAAYDAAHNPTN